MPPMLLSLLCAILRFLRASPDVDSHFERSLLATERLAKLNTYLAGQNNHRNQTVNLIPDTLSLLAQLASSDPKTVLENVRWDLEAFPHILRAHQNRKQWKGKGKEKLKSHQHAESRSRAALLSLVVAMLSQDVPARVKSAFLAPGTPTLSLLQNILAGIGDVYDEEHYAYSYVQIKNLFETLWAGVWCDKRITRSVKISIFAFGQGSKSGFLNDGIKEPKRGGHVTGEKLWKGLLALYSRTDHESSLSEGRNSSGDDEGGVPADLVHHFLLALCTRSGQGLCFRDQGWYPPSYSDKPEDRDDEADSHIPSVSHEDEDTPKNHRYTSHNPLLLRVLRLLTPTNDIRQQELAAQILEACPGLTSSCSDVISGGPGALDPKINARWMIGMAWYGRVVELPVPEDTLYMSTTGDPAAPRIPRLIPPPVRNVVESIMPSFTGSGTKTVLTKALGPGGGTENRTTGESGDHSPTSGLGLVQHTTAMTLCRCLRKLSKVQAAFFRAARAAGELEDEGITYTKVERTTAVTRPWTRRLAEVNKEIRGRLPDIQVVLAFLKRIEASPSAVNATSVALLSESAHRLIWLYYVCFVSTSTLGAAEEALWRFDVGTLMASVSIFSNEQQDEQHQDDSSVDDISGLTVLKDVHILRTLCLSTEFGSRVFGKVGNLKQTSFHLLARAFARGSVSNSNRRAGHRVLHSETSELLEQVLSRSLMFRRHEGKEDQYRGGAMEEIRVWLSTLADVRGYNEADNTVALLDDCVQRYLRTPERYLDAFDEIRDTVLSDTAGWSNSLPSPLVMTLIEQLGHRIHAITVQEQQGSFETETPIHSLRALLNFVQNLFVRLAGICEPPTLPVLRLLVDKISTGRRLDDTAEGEAVRLARTEVARLQTWLAFEPSYSKLDKIEIPATRYESMDETQQMGFEMMFANVVSSASFVSPALRSEFTRKVMDSSTQQISSVLRAVCLISHRLTTIRDVHEDDEPHTEPLISLLAEMLGRVRESEVPLPMKRLVHEYVFRRNEVLREFWTLEASSSICEAIKQLLSNIDLKLSEVVSGGFMADITMHWASYLRTRLRIPTSGDLIAAPSESTPQLDLALLWLRYAHPHVLCNLFDLAHSYRSHPELSAIAIPLLSTTLKALGTHAKMASEAVTVAETDTSAVEKELRHRLSVFFTLFSEREQQRHELDRTSLEELILYALQSRSPVGYDGIPPNNEHSINSRRHRWKQRLETIDDMPHSDQLVQMCFRYDNTLKWSSITSEIVCCAIYNGYIALNSLSSGLAHLQKSPDIMLRAAELLVPVLHAHLDCLRISGTLSEMDADRRGEFWQVYGSYFPFLLNITLHTHTTVILPPRTRTMCGICIVILLELAAARPPSYGQKLVDELMKHVQTIGKDEMSSELLGIGKTCGSFPGEGFDDVVACIVDHALRWTVRMLTGCHEIEGDNVLLVSRIADLLARTTTIKSHLAEPVLTAIVREHLHSESALMLLNTILPKADLKPLVVNRHLQILVQHPSFGKAATKSSKRALVDTLYTLILLHPSNTCQPSHIQPLIALYRGSISVVDRKLLAIFRLFEHQRRTSIATLLTKWTPLSECLQPATAFEALKNVDSLIVLRTALHFPQWRLFESEDWDEWPEASENYDPVFLLLLFAHVLFEDTPKTATGWVELFRTNIVGLVIRALSAKDDNMRQFAAAQIAVLWKCLEQADMLEKPHVFHILGLLRDVLHPTHGHIPERLPSYATLLLAHALRGVFYPSNFVYPITARFLLQRPILDSGDVPMLYGMLYSSAEDHGKKDHIWIIRMLADGMQSSVDWRVFKRRHTWDLLASVFQSEENERALRRGVLEVLANLTCIPEATMSLLLKSNLLAWIEMQLLTPQEDEGLAWLKILENILVVSHHEKMETSTSGQWRACIVRCVLLLITCRSLCTFPIIHLVSGIVLRVALLPGSLPSQMLKLLTQCVDAVKTQERHWTLLSATPSSSVLPPGPLFQAPHSAFRLHEVPVVSESASHAAQGELIERLWRVAMLVGSDRTLAAWDELSGLLLLFRAHEGEQSLVADWVRREVVRNLLRSR
ncbi:hypothetical protein F5880DRAFT_1102471 [Lentinula raphanica]|nr:hypothetical protein F5880DRAFT_1102471 [Lentinula raphanica]